MSSIVVRSVPGSSGHFCGSIIQSLITGFDFSVDTYGRVHDIEKFPDVVQSHDLLEEIIDLFDHVVQIIIDKKDLHHTCSHFYYSCLKRWWDIKLLKMYHPNYNKQELLNIFLNKKLPRQTLNAMIEYHSKYEYAFKPFPDDEIIPISLDCLLNGDPVNELKNYFPTQNDLTNLRKRVQEYQQAHKKIYRL